MLSAIALRLLRAYPLPWRERYEAEVCALIEDSSLRWRDVAEILRGMLIERARELVSSTERRGRTIAVIGALRFAFALMFAGCAIALGLALRHMTGAWSDDALEYLVWALIPATAAFFTILFRTRTRPFSLTEPRYPAWVGAVLLPALFVAVTTMVWAGVWARPNDARPWFDVIVSYWNLFYASLLATNLLSSLWPTRRLLFACMELAGAEQQIKSNETWAASCREWIAKGVPSPLAQAEAQVALWTEKRDAARERLRAMGYRARFERHTAKVT